MNAKRQTIWLVSMLSLMVVLSAYYLFSDPAGPSDPLTTAAPSGATEATAQTGASQPPLDELVVTEVTLEDGAISELDQRVLSQLEELETASVSSDYFNQQLMQRSEALNREFDRLYSILADTTNLKPEEATAVADELSKLEEKDSKLTSIEDELQAEFAKVVVAEESDKYKVVVQSEKLERSQADSIISIVMDTMDVPADRVTVQYLP